LLSVRGAGFGGQTTALIVRIDRNCKAVAESVKSPTLQSDPCPENPAVLSERPVTLEKLDESELEWLKGDGNRYGECGDGDGPRSPDSLSGRYD